MNKLLILLAFALLLSTNTHAETLDQKKDELKKIYEAGGISKSEYEAIKQKFSSKEKEELDKKKIKKPFSLKNKTSQNNLAKKLNLKIINKKKEDKEEITKKKIDELGKIVKFDETYYPKTMEKIFLGCNNSFKCRGQKAGMFLYKAFNRSPRYNQQHPGSIIKAMAMFEVFYAQKLYSAKKNLERYKSDEYKITKKKDIFEILKIDINSKGVTIGKDKKTNDENEIRSLFGINKGRKNMREALGMTLETPAEEAIKKFWFLGEFLDLGVPQKNEKVDPELIERQKLIEDYKFQIANLKKKLENDEEDKTKKTN